MVYTLDTESRIYATVQLWLVCQICSSWDYGISVDGIKNLVNPTQPLVDQYPLENDFQLKLKVYQISLHDLPGMAPHN